MAIQNARSNTSGNAPTSLQDGQIAINQIDDILFSRRADGTIRRALLPKRYGLADAAFTVRAFDTYIGVASLTASRTITLPAALAYPAGQPLMISDESGACSPTVVLTLAATGSDKIDGGATMALTAAYGALILVSDGTSKWTVIAQPAAGAANAVLYVGQSILPGQQLVARQNIGARGGGVTALTTAYTVTGADAGRLLSCSGAFTLTLTSAPTLGNGFSVEVRNAGAGTITVTPSASQTINGSSTLALTSGQSVTLICDGTNWQAFGLAPGIVATSGNAASGYRQMSDGFLQQWISTSVNGDATVTFPIAFPNACRSLVGTIISAYNANALTVQVGSITNVNFTAGLRLNTGTSLSAYSGSVYFLATGF